MPPALSPSLERDADVNVFYKGVSIPLRKAAENGRKAVVRLLLDRGADVNAADEYSRTPVYMGERV
jgi:ankyrin repeat protein